ncbi:hypothetical protein [Leifsonia sp. SIMBA_070]|uniref:hypothetical protein n=1 Tax=Leifsonia sp. SIMBA_070 TaxID=3085810 RepID=UPI00397E88B4
MTTETAFSLIRKTTARKDVQLFLIGLVVASTAAASTTLICLSCSTPGFGGR